MIILTAKRNIQKEKNVEEKNQTNKNTRKQNGLSGDNHRFLVVMAKGYFRNIN